MRGEDLLSQQTHACADSVQDRLGENHKETSKRKADEDGNDKESKMKESCRGNRLDARDIEKDLPSGRISSSKLLNPYLDRFQKLSTACMGLSFGNTPPLTYCVFTPTA